MSGKGHCMLLPLRHRTCIRSMWGMFVFIFCTKKCKKNILLEGELRTQRCVMSLNEVYL